MNSLTVYKLFKEAIEEAELRLSPKYWSVDEASLSLSDNDTSLKVTGFEGFDSVEGRRSTSGIPGMADLTMAISINVYHKTGNIQAEAVAAKMLSVFDRLLKAVLTRGSSSDGIDRIAFLNQVTVQSVDYAVQTLVFAARYILT